jgi:HK97 family phage major capsid protein
MDAKPVDQTMRGLTDQIGRTWESQKAILDKALEEGRALSAEERENVEHADADLESLIKDRDRYAARSEQVAAANTFRESIAPAITEAREQRREPTDEEMLWQLIKGERRAMTSEFIQTRALQSEGGTAVATNFADMFSVYARTLNPTIRLARVYNTPTGNAFVLPTVTADAAGGGTVTAENAGITLADGTIGAVTLNSYKYASIQSVSTQLYRDSVGDLMDVLAETGGRQIGLNFGAALTTGDGSGDPNGFITAGSAGHTATSGTAGGQQAHDTFFGPLDIISLYYSVAVPWRAVGAWQASNGALVKIRSFRDSNGLYLFDPGLTTDFQPALMGRPIYENPGMAAVDSCRFLQ